MQAPYIRPGIKPASEWAPLPKLHPTASYDPQRRVAAVANAYPVKEVLRAGGYRWHESTKTWQRSNLSIEEFKADYDLFQNLGVNLDTPTATLLASTGIGSAEVPAVDHAAVNAKPAKAAPTEGQTGISPASIAKLRKAREWAIRLANAELPGQRGMRIPDATDRGMLREIASILRDVLGEAA